MNEQFSRTIEKLREHCRKNGLKLAVAESLTGGRIQSLITSVSGVSEFFVGGITAYHLDAKVALLEVDREKAAVCDCVSQEIANQMARSVCKVFNSDLGIATTGYAEPAPSANVDIPFAYIAGFHATNAGSGSLLFSERIEWKGDRASVQSNVATSTLNYLLANLAPSSSS